MKLSTKISAAAVSLLLILSQVFAVWNLTQTRKHLLDTIAQAEAMQMQSDFSNFLREYQKMKLYFQDERGECFWAKEKFRSNYSANMVLYYRGTEICNSTPYEFDVQGQKGEKLSDVPGIRYLGDYIQMFRENVDGRNLLVFSQEDNEHIFSVVRVRDVTDVYEQSNALFWRGIAMSALLSACLLIVLVLLLKRILKPFYRLRDAANRIAAGDYARRIEHPGRDEVGEVAASFNGMADRVQEHIQDLAETNEKQRRMLGALSHELKTPLTGIQGYAELMQKVALSPERQMNALDYIRQECRRLNRLSRKMLQLTELSGEQQIEKRPVPAKELLEKAREITVWRLRKQKLHLEIECGGDFAIEGDEDLLLSFLTNLIDNAAKASSPGKTIRLLGTPEGLFVEDEGAGIPEEEIRRVTEPFYMVDKSRSRQQGGAGLGLALCAQIARLHGGTISIQSEVGRGSTIGMKFVYNSATLR